MACGWRVGGVWVACACRVRAVCVPCACRVRGAWVHVHVHMPSICMAHAWHTHMQASPLPPHVDLRAIDAWLLSVRLRQHRSERPPLPPPGVGARSGRSAVKG